MSKPTMLSQAEVQQLDQFYREGGLRTMASPHVHYDEPVCPHEGCGHSMEWIDFKLELHGDPEGIYKPLVQSWWNGVGFVGHCPACEGLIRFQTTGMSLIDEKEAQTIPLLPSNWVAIAQIA